MRMEESLPSHVLKMLLSITRRTEMDFSYFMISILKIIIFVLYLGGFIQLHGKTRPYEFPPNKQIAIR